MTACGKGAGITDFHSHVIPRLDHGSSSVEMSLWQIDMAKRIGVARIVATPHFYANVTDVKSFCSRRESCYEMLRRALPSDAPEIILGAEVLVFESIDRLPSVEKLCIEGTNVFLAELPMNSIDESIADTIRHLIERGLDVVLAHAERYDTDIIDACIDVGAKVQLNAEGIVSHRGRKKCMQWIEYGSVYALGSDIHGKRNEYAHFKKALKILGCRGEEILAKTNALLKKQ